MSNKLIYVAVIATLANIAVSHNEVVFFIVTSIVFICVCLLLLMYKRIKLSFACMLIIVWICFSMLRMYVDYHNQSLITLSMEDTQVDVTGYIDSAPERDGDRISFDLKLTHLHSEQYTDTKAETIRIQLYLSEQQEIVRAEELSRGQSISLGGKLVLPNQAQNDNQFDYRLFLKRQSIHWILQVEGINQLTLLADDISHTNKILKLFDELKERLYEPFPKLFNSRHAGYLGGLVFGMKSELDPILFQSFSQLGLTHILAVSGLHVAVVVTSLLYLFKLIRLPRSLSYTITIALLPFYVVITGAEPSIIRAGIMGMIGLWLVKHHKLKNTEAILASAALLMMAVNPFVIYNIGFQLSFLVTLGLLIYTPLIRQLLPLSKSKIYDAISVTISAQLASFPLTIAYFNMFNPLSLLANFALVPYISFIILPLATFTNVVGHFSIKLAEPLAVITMYGNEFSFFIVDYLNKLDRFNIIWKTPSVMWIVVFYCLVFILLSTCGQWFKIKRIINAFGGHQFSYRAIINKSIILLLLFLLLISYAHSPHLFSLERKGEVSFISVGQGDSILITTPTNKHILIDSGGQIPFAEKEEWAKRKDPFDIGKDIMLPLLKKRGIKELDIMVVTHFDADHFQGFLAILDVIKVKEVWLNGSYKEDEYIKLLLTKMVEKDISIVMVEQGDEIKIDRYTDIQVLWPDKSLKNQSNKQNDQSIVLLMSMYESQFLFTGDIGEQQEQDIVNHLYPVMMKNDRVVDVLKVAHHGSKYSTSTRFLAFFEPRLAVVSVGENNRYGHPHPDVVKRLDNYQIPLLRTDLQGEIIIKISANSITYKKWRREVSK